MSSPPGYESTGGSKNEARERRKRKKARDRKRADMNQEAMEGVYERGRDNDAYDSRLLSSMGGTDELPHLENYSYGPERPFVGGVLFVSNTLVMALIAALAAANPAGMSGGSAVLKTEDEFVGVLRKCSTPTCDPWMAGDTAEGDSTAFNYANMFLLLGTATITSLWFATLIWLINVVRLFTSVPDSSSTGTWDGIKRFLYRTTRALMMVNCIMIPSLVIDILIRSMKYKEAKKGTIGGGIAILFFAWLFTLLSTLIELRRPGGTVHRWILKLNILGTCCGICTGEDTGRKAEEGESIEMRKPTS